MVRITDLVKGSTPSPASKSDAPEEGVRLSNLSDLVTWGKNAAPTDIAPDKLPGAAPEGVPPKPPEHDAPPPADGPFSPDSKALYFNAQRYLQEIKTHLIAGEPISLEKPREMIERMITQPALVDEMYQLTREFGHSDDMYIASPVNSMIYSFKIGMRMGYTPAKLTEICLAALHHDIGMYLMPENIIGKDGTLTDDEFALIKKHTALGRDIFIALNHPNVARAIYEHHERENGRGYPLGLKGNEISEYAKIIGICDSYEAMTHDRPHKKAAAQYLSVLQLAGSKDMLFAPSIVKMFLDVITLYPIGSYVRLNNKAIGLVVKTNPHNPLKPLVRIVIDGHGKKTGEEKLIDLAGNNILTIVAGVSAADLSA